MSRRGRRDAHRRATSRSSPASRPNARRGPLLPWLALLVVAVAVLALWRLRTNPARPVAAADSLAAMDPLAAYERAIALMSQARSHHSLPYFRHALRSPVVSGNGSAHLNYANALYNSLFELDTLSGRPLAVVGSSVTRVAMMREVLDHYALAQTYATTPEFRGQVFNEMARALQVWGFEWEALLAHQQAQRAAPNVPAYAHEADAFLQVMREPDLGRASAPEVFDPH